MTTYSWKCLEHQLNTEQYRVVLDQHRHKMLNSNDVDDKFIIEWIALTTERDRVFHIQRHQLLREQLDNALLRLHYWLQFCIGKQYRSLVTSPALLQSLDTCYANVDDCLRTKKYDRPMTIIDDDTIFDVVDGGSSSSTSCGGRIGAIDDNLDVQSIVSETTTFLSAVSNQHHRCSTINNCIGGRYFPGAFNHSFLIANRLSTDIEEVDDENDTDDGKIITNGHLPVINGDLD